MEQGIMRLSASSTAWNILAESGHMPGLQTMKAETIRLQELVSFLHIDLQQLITTVRRMHPLADVTTVRRLNLFRRFRQGFAVGFLTLLLLLLLLLLGSCCCRVDLQLLLVSSHYVGLLQDSYLPLYHILQPVEIKAFG